MPSAVDNIILHEDDAGSVSPSWLIEGSSRYAIRTVVRLEHKEFKPVTGGAMCGFFAGIALMVAAAYYYWQSLPTFLCVGFLLLGILMAAAGAFHWLSAKSRYKIAVILLDGSEVQLTRLKQDEHQRLLDALTKAMDWHRNGEFIIDAERESHINKRIATGSVKSGPAGKGKDEPDNSNKIVKSVLLRLPVGNRNR